MHLLKAQVVQVSRVHIVYPRMKFRNHGISMAMGTVSYLIYLEARKTLLTNDASCCFQRANLFMELFIFWITNCTQCNYQKLLLLDYLHMNYGNAGIFLFSDLVYSVYVLHIKLCISLALFPFFK